MSELDADEDGCHACMEIRATGHEDANGIQHTCELSTPHGQRAARIQALVTELEALSREHGSPIYIVSGPDRDAAERSGRDKCAKYARDYMIYAATPNEQALLGGLAEQLALLDLDKPIDGK